MVRLGRIKLRRIGYLGNDRCGRREDRCEALNHFQRLASLLRGMNEDRRTVLRSNVGPLAIQRGRIVYGEEHFKKLAVRNQLRIEVNSNRFGVARCPRAHFFIGRVRIVATAIAGGDTVNPRQL